MEGVLSDLLSIAVSFADDLKEAPPFTYTAIDFAGPLYLRGKEANTSKKVWICLFTCCVSRAVHIELVLDMTTVTFIQCIKRFAAK